MRLCAVSACEVLAVHVDLGLGGEADLARVERHLGAHLDRRAVRVGRGHDQARRPGLLALRLRAPDQHRDLLRVEAALDDRRAASPGIWRSVRPL